MADAHTPQPAPAPSDDPTRASSDISGGAPPLISPDNFPGYRVIGPISRGGQGVVLHAIQEGTQREVAIKLAAGDAFESAVAERRFEREINLVAKLRHPNVISIFHAGRTTAGRPFFVMDYVDGLPLTAHARSAELTVRGVLALFEPICRAVHHAHEQGIIHRDLKPSNILVDRDGEPRVLDFGLARLLAAPSDPLITHSHEVVGTIRYMSPEHAAGDPARLDARSDVYSLGVVLFELLTGDFPYPVVGPPMEVLDRVAHVPPAAARARWTPASGARPDAPQAGRDGKCPIDAEVETIVQRCLAKEPYRRYASAAELADDIARYLAGRPIHARRDRPSYVVAKYGRAWLTSHRAAALMLVVAVACLAADSIGRRIVFQWTPANRWVETALTSGLAGAPAGRVLDQVRVLALSDATKPEELARREGLAEVREADRPSLRRLHGRMMERLTAAQPRVLVWDVMFVAPSPYDDDFVRGVRALRQSGVPVVVAARGFWAGAGGRPAMSELIAREVRWGSATAGFGAGAAWRAPLALLHGAADPIPSLSLATLAAARQPESEYAVRVDLEREILELTYWREDAVLSRARNWLETSDRVVLTAMSRAKADTPEQGVRAGDLLADYVLDMPADDIHRAATIDYRDVFEQDADRLRERVGGKVLFVGDLRGTTDRHPHPDGRTLAGVYGHAVCADALLRGAVAIRRPRNTERIGLITLAAVLGAGVPLIARSTAVRLLLVAAVALVACAASAAVMQAAHFLCNPLVPAFALLVAAGLASAIFRLRLSPVRTPPRQGSQA